MADNALPGHLRYLNMNRKKPIPCYRILSPEKYAGRTFDRLNTLQKFFSTHRIKNSSECLAKFLLTKSQPEKEKEVVLCPKKAREIAEMAAQLLEDGCASARDLTKVACDHRQSSDSSTPRPIKHLPAVKHVAASPNDFVADAAARTCTAAPRQDSVPRSPLRCLSSRRRQAEVHRDEPLHRERVSGWTGGAGRDEADSRARAGGAHLLGGLSGALRRFDVRAPFWRPNVGRWHAEVTKSGLDVRERIDEHSGTE